MEIAAGVHEHWRWTTANVPNASVPKSRMWTHKSGSVRGAVREGGPYSTRWWSTATPTERRHRKRVARRRRAGFVRRPFRGAFLPTLNRWYRASRSTTGYWPPRLRRARGLGPPPGSFFSQIQRRRCGVAQDDKVGGLGLSMTSRV